MGTIKPCIWFQGNAEDAMKYYIETFPNSKITYIERYTGTQGIPDEDKLVGKVLTGTFELNGQPFLCLDGGPVFEMTGAISLVVECETQDELDKIWDRMLDGGTPQQCGWITDKFGVTWQVVPVLLGQLMSDTASTPAQKEAVMKAMMPMVKLESAELQAAFNGAK